MNTEEVDGTQWLRRLQDRTGDSTRAVAIKAGIDPSTLNRAVHRQSLSAEAVIAIARAYAMPPVAALVESGHLAAEEVSAGEVRKALESATDLELAEAIMARAHVAASGGQDVSRS